MLKKSSRIIPVEIRPEMRIKILDDEKLEKIHQATLTVLKEVGVRFPCEKALKVFAEAGAKVDFKSKNVRIPSDLLMDALAKAPRSYTMASRSSPDLDLYLDGTKTYLGTDGTGIATVDLQTRKRRASTKKDVAMMALISDYLPSVSFYWPLVSAQDTPSEVIPLHELEASFTNTEKHVHIISCVEEKTAHYAVEMATLIAGDSKTLRKRPPLSLDVGAVTPLGQDKGALEAALTFAKAGAPVGFGAMPSMGSTAPASVAGAMVVGNAETLSALCLIQLAYPGAPVYYSFLPEMINPHTGGCLASALQKPMLYAGGVELGHYYNLPVMGYYGATDAHEPDRWQTGKDNTIDALLVCLHGPELLPDFGLLEAYTLLYPEKILFDNEIFNSVKAISEGVRVDSETLAIDEIIAVGPGGHFLNREYTRKKLRELWQPGIIHQWSPKDRDFHNPQDAAVEKIKWILKNHRPKPLDEKVKRELKRIMKSAEEELCS